MARPERETSNRFEAEHLLAVVAEWAEYLKTHVPFPNPGGTGS